MKQLILLLIMSTALWAGTINESDSLREELEAITRRLESMERAKLEAQREELEAELRRRSALEPEKDTIIVVDTLIVDRDEEFKESRTEEILLMVNNKLKKGSQSGFGGSGGPSFGVASFSIKPIKEMISNDIGHRKESSPFDGLSFDIKGNYETFFVSGGFGFGGVGNGVRIGGGGYSGSRSYKSMDVSPTDTIKELTVAIGYGGVILEKAWSKENTTVTVGTLLGAGNYTVTLRPIEYAEDVKAYSATAPFFAGELHGAYTISVTNWFHVGLEAYTLLTASSSGFQYSDNFATINAGGRLRLLFGNLR